MHHHSYKPSPQHPLLSNQLQPINSESQTSMWLDDSYTVSNSCPSQRDSGFNSRPASLRSVDSSSTGPMHHGSTQSYEQIPPTHLTRPEFENSHPQYIELQSAPPPTKPQPAQVIPELLNLLMEDDPVIVREAILLTHMLIKEGGESRSEVIRNRELINTLLETFNKDIGDGKIIQGVSQFFYSLSQQQEGLRAIHDCGGVPRLLQHLYLGNPSVNYVTSILHNFLIVLQEQAANEIDRYEGIQKFIDLLDQSNDKLLTLVADSLLKLSSYNKKSKLALQNNELGIQRLLHIFDTSSYDKLLLTISKLLPIISSGNEVIKKIMIQLNALNIFEKHLKTTKSIRIKHNCLTTLRNLSNQATRMRDLDSLIQHLTGLLLSPNDRQSVVCSLGILNNLTANNRSNKSLFVQLNGVQTLMQKLVMETDENDDFIEIALCTLQHITARHDLEDQAREIIRKSYGIGNIIKFLGDKNLRDHFGILKATVGLIENLTISQTIIPYICEQNAVRRLSELMINIDRIQSKLIDDKTKYDAILENLIRTLTNLIQYSTSKTIIRENNCTNILSRLTQLPSSSLQQSASVLLRELNNE